MLQRVAEKFSRVIHRGKPGTCYNKHVVSTLQLHTASGQHHTEQCAAIRNLLYWQRERRPGWTLQVPATHAFLT